MIVIYLRGIVEIYLPFLLYRQLVLGTDSFIESFTSPEHEEATSVDQLGLPGRNPMLAGKCVRQ